MSVLFSLKTERARLMQVVRGLTSLAANFVGSRNYVAPSDGSGGIRTHLVESPKCKKSGILVMMKRRGMV